MNADMIPPPPPPPPSYGNIKTPTGMHPSMVMVALVFAVVLLALGGLTVGTWREVRLAEVCEARP